MWITGIETTRMSDKKITIIYTVSTKWSQLVLIIFGIQHYELEACIKTSKRPQAPGDANVGKCFFDDNIIIFRLDQKE